MTGIARNDSAAIAYGDRTPSGIGPSVNLCHRSASNTNAIAPPQMGSTAQAPDGRSRSPKNAAEVTAGTTTNASGYQTPRIV